MVPEKMDDADALLQLSTFVNDNYNLIRDLRENAMLHMMFSKELGKLHDILLNLMFSLQKCNEGWGGEK